MKTLKNFSKIILTISLAIITGTMTLQAQTTYTTSSNGNWNTSGNWEGNSAPGSEIGSNDEVIVSHEMNFQGNDNSITVLDGGSLTIEGNGSFVSPGGSKHLILLIEDGGTMLNNGNITAESITVNGYFTNNGDITAETITINDGGTLDNTNGVIAYENITVESGGLLIETDDEGTLPVDLISFNVQMKDHIVELQWATASEINNDYFTVERSIDGSQFTELGTVEGSGNSNQVIHYSFTDGSYTPGMTVYYRIKQTDYDGTYSYSQVLDLGSASGVDVNIFPSPALHGETVTIHAPYQNARISIYDMQGRLLQDFSAQQEHTQLNTGDLRPGTYVVRIAAPGKEQIASKRLYIK